MPDEVKIQKPPPQGAEPRPEGEFAPPPVLPLMPLRDAVLFPGIVHPLTVGRPKSLALVQDVAIADRLFVVATQKDSTAEDPPFDDVHHVGCAVRILKLIRLPDGNQTVIVQALARVRLGTAIQTTPYFKAGVALMADQVEEGTELQALVVSARQLIVRIIELSPRLPQEAAAVVTSIELSLIHI